MDFFFADDDAVFGEFGGVGKFVAKFFAGQNDGSAVAFGAELVGYTEGFVEFVFRNWDDGVV